MVLETILGKELTRHFTFQIGVRKMKTEGRDANLVWCGYVEVGGGVSNILQEYHILEE